MSASPVNSNPPQDLIRDLPSSLVSRLASENAAGSSPLDSLSDPLPSARAQADRELILAAPEAARRLRLNLSSGLAKDQTAAALAILDRSPATSLHAPTAAQATFGEDALRILMSGLAAFIGSAVTRSPSFRTVSPEGPLASDACLPSASQTPENSSSFTPSEHPVLFSSSDNPEVLKELP